MRDEGEAPDTTSMPGRKRGDESRLEDERWAARRQRRDWMWLGLMIVVYSAWTLIVFLLEPGLR
jgi:hypothetical protein